MVLRGRQIYSEVGTGVLIAPSVVRIRLGIAHAASTQITRPVLGSFIWVFQIIQCRKQLS